MYNEYTLKKPWRIIIYYQLSYCTSSRQKINDSEVTTHLSYIIIIIIIIIVVVVVVLDPR